MTITGDHEYDSLSSDTNTPGLQGENPTEDIESLETSSTRPSPLTIIALLLLRRLVLIPGIPADPLLDFWGGTLHTSCVDF